MTTSPRRVLRAAVVRFSIHNRRRKARAINAFLDEHGCRTLLLVGTVGAVRYGPNTALVEDLVSAGRTVVMGINVHPTETPYPFVVADGRDMPFADDFVDFSLSNAVIEHVGDESDQRRLVAEQTRVGRCWVITTPNRWFPVEPHTTVLFRHWFASWRSGRGEFTRLLSRREFAELLPPGAVLEGSWWSPTFTAYYARPAGLRRQA
jgi:hypothetical protein